MENGLNLHQRVALIAGPMTTTVSSIVMSLTRLGADCVILDTDKSVASAFTNQINDQREINDKYGRAMVIQGEFKTPEQVKDAVGRAAQTFGGLDIYIDALMIQQPTPMKFDGSIENFDGLIDKHLKLPMMLTQSVMAYLKSRKKGRVVYLLNESPVAKIKEDIAAQAVRSGLVQFAQALAKQTSEFNVTVNAMTVALTEEYILAHDPESKSIKEAMEKMKAIDPSLKITEADKISQTIAFMVSPMGATMNGQKFALS
ncbi:SDR family NAD(P)-dependent oxidoreductase [Bdellovibrio sp. NC01]|uniref:SDR family NAD(P)-dependent oxidoreductase n=1 Tax=Bdellovibrio sp. NC01 TaxID=2220073 RepID=UPI00115B23E0|nr:SDR family oxidoreductase [Bdellovibrio sp. NC01]QDK36486.1 SDR family NAD(P)-dependent oxidoreductase [Bdellovibrio sp. NC01]